MSNVITFPASSNINVNNLKRPSRSLADGLIKPAENGEVSELAKEREAEPIKDMRDIIRISEYLIENERYRDNMLFVVGINFGLRVSDLRLLRFTDIIDDTFTFRDCFEIWEKKTRNTRKTKKNRRITINDAVVDAVTLYLQHTENVSLSDYMFRSDSNNGRDQNVPIHRNSIDRILKGIAKDLHLPYRIATHSLRKTFGYHQMVMSNNSPRKLMLLQKMFGHSSMAVTLDYIGITDGEIEEAYSHLNLGSSYHYLVDSNLIETAAM